MHKIFKFQSNQIESHFVRPNQSHFTFLTMVSRGCRLAKPPGGNVEHPVVNCRKAFLSSEDMPHKTLTNRKKPGLERKRDERGGKDKKGGEGGE